MWEKGKKKTERGERGEETQSVGVVLLGVCSAVLLSRGVCGCAG